MFGAEPVLQYVVRARTEGHVSTGYHEHDGAQTAQPSVISGLSSQ